MKAWLKGGLIGALVYLIWGVSSLIRDIDSFWLGTVISILKSLIIGFLIGAVLTLIFVKTKDSKLNNWLKGSILGVLFGIVVGWITSALGVMLVLYLNGTSISSLRGEEGLVIPVIGFFWILAIGILGLIIGFIIGKIKSRA